MDPSITYTSLNKDKQQIRILLLLPGAFDDPIRCDLSIESTDNRFEALSYVWGDMNDTLPIQVQDRDTKVTRNLEGALRRLRSQHEIRRLWVDAVCINQRDALERNHQVRMMGTVYERAERVIAWLGQDEGPLTTMRVVQHFGTDPDIHWDPIKHFTSNDDVKTKIGGIFGLIPWLRNDWYTRIWTLQEASLAKSLVYVCGSFIFQRGEIENVVESFYRHFVYDECCDLKNITGEHIIGLGLNLTSSTKKVSDTISLRNRRGRLGFLEIASGSRHRQGTNPRDKVFGILGLVDDIPKEIIDYRKSVADIYLLTALECIKSSGNLDVLTHVLPKRSIHEKSKAGDPVSHHLPSWVPDWNDHRPDDFLRLDALRVRQSYTKLFNACRHNTQARPERPSPTSLRLQGYFCDQISQTGDTFVTKVTMHVEYFLDWRKMVKADEEPERPYISGSTIMDAFWRTICLNTSITGEKADVNTRRIHDIWWWKVLLETKYAHIRKQARIPDKPALRLFGSHACQVSYGRKLFISKKGYIGLAPEGAQEGDEIWVLDGGRLPLILRRLDTKPGDTSEPKYTFVGGSYVHGIMEGEFVEASMKKGELPRPVVLV
ncbi:hypothetical protein M426DRAFT_264004 [Hypoxylon sp. CI-4A]|nr:hypothetical protein M426DRAFT_264004 [Hypoxylon sp. CI-4A]